MREKRTSAEGSPPTPGEPLPYSVLVPPAFAVLALGLLAVFGGEPVVHCDDPYAGFARRVSLFVPDVDAGLRREEWTI